MLPNEMKTCKLTDTHTHIHTHTCTTIPRIIIVKFLKNSKRENSKKQPEVKDPLHTLKQTRIQ